MNSAFIPKDFSEWKHCIEVECGLSLTPQYIEQRIEALQQDKDHYTQQFIKLYGEEYRQQVLVWFNQAREMVTASN